MRKIYILLIISLVFNLYAKAQLQGIHIYEGSIDKYPIKMVLNFNHGEVHGFYCYINHMIKIPVIGEIKNENLVLEESFNLITHKVINCKLINHKLQGEWIDSTKNKKMMFYANSIVDKTVKEDIKFKSLTGEFENVLDSNKNNSGVTLSYISNNLFYFMFSCASENCTGFLTGIVELDSKYVGIYHDNSCKELKFNISSELIEVNEKQCDYHGALCSFEGKYKRAK
jgi:hypothetical protein